MHAGYLFDSHEAPGSRTYSNMKVDLQLDPKLVRPGHLYSMARGNYEAGLPTTHPRRMEMRDAKMWRREAEKEARTGQTRSRCPCSLCLFGRPMLRSTHAVHLQQYGRHPMKRLQPQVSDRARPSCCKIVRLVHEQSRSCLRMGAYAGRWILLVLSSAPVVAGRRKG